MTHDELVDLANLRRARDLMDRDFARPLDVPTLAKKALMSPAHFSRKFAAAYGETPYRYLCTRRIERAMALLRVGSSVTDACIAVGFSSLGSFSARFTELVGESPSSYRRRQHPAIEAMPACVARSTRGPFRAVFEKRSNPWRPRFAVMTLSLQYCPITVNDVDESLPFYRDALGLEVRNDVANGGHRWVTLGSAGQPAAEIVLSDPHAGRSPADGDALQELLTKGSLPVLVFRADDLDATWERMLASGAEVLQEPIDQPWGPRDFAIRDPSGNTVRVAQA